MLLREYLQSIHSISRRKFTDLVDAHKIFLDAHVVDSYKQEILGGEVLMVHSDPYTINEKIKISENTIESLMVLFNKPVGYVVSKSDPHNATIYELLPPEFQGFYYIGRLDKDSHGLLLLTNDPKMVNEFEHPKFEIEKEYIVQINRPLTSRDAERMVEGLKDEDDILKVAKVTPHVVKNTTILNILLHEGKKRHIRRIFKAMGYKVLDLQRIREGKFELGDLKLKTWKIVPSS